MQTFTLATALVASVAYAADYKLELVKGGETDAWATTDIKVDWKQAKFSDEYSYKTIQMEITGEFKLVDEEFRGWGRNKAQWYFCWNDTNECWTTKQSDESTAGKFFLQNWIAFSEDKREHSGNTWPGEYGASTEWWVYYAVGETEFYVDVDNIFYNADWTENQFTDEGWTTQSYQLWDVCQKFYDEIIFGMERKATIAMYAEHETNDPQFISKEVTVKFPAATAQQKEALNYAAPGTADFKKGCNGNPEDFVVSANIQTYLDGYALGQKATSSEEYWTTDMEMLDYDGETVVANAAFSLNWENFTEAEDFTSDDFNNRINFKVEVDQEVAIGDFVDDSFIMTNFCWDDNNLCYIQNKYYKDGTYRLSQYTTFSSKIKNWNTASQYSSDVDEWWTYISSAAEDTLVKKTLSDDYFTTTESSVFNEYGFKGQINTLIDDCDYNYDKIVNGISRDAVLGFYVRHDGGEWWMKKKVSVDFQKADEDMLEDLDYISFGESGFKEICDVDEAAMAEWDLFQRGFADGDTRAPPVKEEEDVVVVEDDEEVVVEDDEEVVVEDDEEDDVEEEDNGSGEVKETCSKTAEGNNRCIDVVCAASTECDSLYCNSDGKCQSGLDALSDSLDDVTAGVGAFLIVVFIVIPCCFCIGICWCVYCCMAKKCCCAEKGEHTTSH